MSALKSGGNCRRRGKATEEAAAHRETVRFTNDEACGGMFEELENWLTGHGIDFDRHSDARYEFDGENAYGRGKKSPVIMLSDQASNDLVSVEGIGKILAREGSPGRKLASIAMLIAVPAELTPVVLVDKKGK